MKLIKGTNGLSNIVWDKFRNPEEYPNYQTPEICLEAVKKYGRVLSLVKNQTEELCILAVRNRWYAYSYAKVITPKVSMELIKQNPCSLVDVETQTPEICLYVLEGLWKKVFTTRSKSQ